MLASCGKSLELFEWKIAMTSTRSEDRREDGFVYEPSMCIVPRTRNGMAIFAGLVDRVVLSVD